MDPIEQMRRDWDDRARKDAFYYVAFAEREQNLEQFLATAARDITCFETELVRIPASSPRPTRALEIGCGPGRLMLPMSKHFDEIHGVDISPEMIRLAGETLRNVPGARLHVAEESDLRMLASNTFDFVYSYTVFQHIPSREVVLNYMNETARVLKPGGIGCCQLRGAPQLASQLASEAPTWTGCYFVWQDIKDYVQANGLELVAISGLETQYTLMTVRKPDGSTDASAAHPLFNAVTPASGSGSSVPRKGLGSAVSLWLDAMPAGPSLLDFEVTFGGAAGFPCYLSPRLGDSGHQVNVLLPAGLAAARVPVQAIFRGTPLNEVHEITVVDPPPLTPSVVSIADGLDVGCPTIRSNAVKVYAENIEDPQRIGFRMGKGSPMPVEFVAVDPITSQFQFSVALPALPAGNHVVRWFNGDVELAAFSIEVEAPRTTKPAR